MTTKNFYIALTSNVRPGAFVCVWGTTVGIGPRMLDKGRATLAGKRWLYIGFTTDQRLVQFRGFDPKALLKTLHRQR